MLDREQVLHVARLARLRLSEDEVGVMAKELSGILEHVERIDALDLASVEPTSHVVQLSNVFRGDTPIPSDEAEEMLEQAPDRAGDGYRAPSPQA